MPARSLTLHASAVAFGGGAALILGASGTGKSSLALRLVSLGACLVADDQVVLRAEGETLRAHPAPNLQGMIEARGVGILRAEYQDAADVTLIVDLDQTEKARHPEWHTKALLDLSLPCLQKSDYPAFPEAILQYLKAGRAEV